MHLRPVNESDITLIFNWANDEEVRANAINKERILWEDHEKWFYKKLLDTASNIYILEGIDGAIGQIRFEKVNGYCEIDYSIDEKYRGLGYGYKIVCLGIQKMFQKGNSNIKAIVNENNIASQRIFEKASFRKIKFEEYKGEMYNIYTLEMLPKKFLILSSKAWNENTLVFLRNKLPLHEWVSINKKEDFTLEKLNHINPNKIFIPHWSHLIHEEIFSNFECVVFHMTDLPFGRGGSPLQNLISRGYKETKISALKVTKELDAGDIYLKKSLSLLGSAEEIFIRANNQIEKMIYEIVVFGLKPVSQQGIPVVFKRRTPEMSEITEEIQDIEKFYDHIRMLDAEGYPKAFIETEFFRLEFSRASLKADKTIIADVRITKK